MTHVKILSPIREIGPGAFSRCVNLTSVEFPPTLRVIDENAFNGCSKLSSVEFPSQLKVIGDNAFCGTALRSVFIPPAVQTIGKNAFDTRSLKEASVPSQTRYERNSFRLAKVTIQTENPVPGGKRDSGKPKSSGGGFFDRLRRKG